jgi:hypothetical protein
MASGIIPIAAIVALTINGVYQNRLRQWKEERSKHGIKEEKKEEEEEEEEENHLLKIFKNTPPRDFGELRNNVIKR